MTWTCPGPHESRCWLCGPDTCCHGRVHQAQGADMSDLLSRRPRSRWKRFCQHPWLHRPPARAGQPRQTALQAVRQKRRSSAPRTTSSGYVPAWCRCVLHGLHPCGPAVQADNQSLLRLNARAPCSSYNQLQKLSCSVQLEVDLPVVALPDGIHSTSFRGDLEHL